MSNEARACFLKCDTCYGLGEVQDRSAGRLETALVLFDSIRGGIRSGKPRNLHTQYNAMLPGWECFVQEKKKKINRKRGNDPFVVTEKTRRPKDR